MEDEDKTLVEDDAVIINDENSEDDEISLDFDEVDLEMEEESDFGFTSSNNDKEEYQTSEPSKVIEKICMYILYILFFIVFLFIVMELDKKPSNPDLQNQPEISTQDDGVSFNAILNENPQSKNKE